MLRALALVTLALSIALLAGCAAKGPAQAKVSKDDVASTRTVFESLDIGEPKPAVLEQFKKGYKLRLGAATVRGTKVEEWKIEAYHDDDWNKTRDLFVGFMYFADNRLVETSTTRVDYRSSPTILDNWTQGSRVN